MYSLSLDLTSRLEKLSSCYSRRIVEWMNKNECERKDFVFLLITNFYSTWSENGSFCRKRVVREAHFSMAESYKNFENNLIKSLWNVSKSFFEIGKCSVLRVFTGTLS